MITDTVLSGVCMQTLVDRAFSSRVRCLAADAESDVLWAGDESGRLAVLRYNEVTDKVDCTAIILPGRRNAVMSLGGLRGRTIPAMTDGLKPKPRYARPALILTPGHNRTQPACQAAWSC